MRPLTLLVLLASSAFAQTGVSVCGNLLTGSDRANCMGVINGHTIDPNAARVCGNLLTSDDRVRCLQVALDKQYSADEANVCGGLLTSADRTTCMANAGRLASRRDRVRERDDDDDEPRERRTRRSRRGDDDEGASITFENRTRRVKASRFFWREAGAREWSLLTNKRLRPDDSLEVGPLRLGRYDLCVETDDGRRGIWANVRLGRDGYRAWFDGEGLADGDCR